MNVSIKALNTGPGSGCRHPDQIPICIPIAKNRGGSPKTGCGSPFSNHSTLIDTINSPPKTEHVLKCLEGLLLFRYRFTAPLDAICNLLQRKMRASVTGMYFSHPHSPDGLMCFGGLCFHSATCQAWSATLFKIKSDK